MKSIFKENGFYFFGGLGEVISENHFPPNPKLLFSVHEKRFFEDQLVFCQSNTGKLKNNFLETVFLQTNGSKFQLRYINRSNHLKCSPNY